MTIVDSSNPAGDVPVDRADVVVRPLRRTTDGLGVYDRHAPILVKNLREAGAVVEYEDPPETRRFLDQNSAAEVVTAALALNLLSSAGYDALRWAFGRMGRGVRLHLRLRRGTEGPDETFDGCVEDALDLLASDIPNLHAPAVPIQRVSADVVSERRYSTTREVEDRLQSAEDALSQASDLRSTEHPDADATARTALEQFSSALNWAEGGPFEKAVHARMDQAGRWVRETFGCLVHREGTSYSQRCPVALGHNRMGMSVGGLSRKVCSICGEDFSECIHRPGVEYVIQGGVGPLEWCRVCAERDGCEHLPDERYRARLVVIVVEMQLEEVSLVHRPAFRDARITSVPYSNEELQEALGDDFQPGQDLSCDRCLLECVGLKGQLANGDE